MKIGIVGAGLVGGSLYLSWEKIHQVLVYDKKDLPVKKTSLEEIAEKSDLIWIATNPKKTAPLANRLFSLGARAICDVSSVKESVLSEIKSQYREKFIACHPLAGGEKSGFENARRNLLENATWAICSEPKMSDLILISSLIDHMNGKIIFTDPKSHDRAVAFSSHLVQIIQMSLARELEKKSDLYFYLSGPALLDSTRLAGSQFSSLWKEIIDLNSKNISDDFYDFKESLTMDNLDQDWSQGKSARKKLIEKRWSEESFKTVTIKEEDFWPKIKTAFFEVPVKKIRRAGREIAFDVKNT